MRSPTMLDASDSKSAKRSTGALRHLKRQGHEAKGQGRRCARVKSSSASVAEMPQSIAAATRQKLGMHRFLRMSAHKAHALGQRMSRGKRHGKCGKCLGHGLFCIVLLAPALKAIPSGANGKRSNKSQGKSEGR